MDEEKKDLSLTEDQAQQMPTETKAAEAEKLLLRNKPYVPLAKPEGSISPPCRL